MSGMMNSPVEFFQWAMSLQDYTPTAETAKAVCMMRAQPPYDYVPCTFGSLMAWQAVALEGVLLAAIARNEPNGR